MTKTEDGKVFLTPDEAMKLIVKGKYVHTFMNPSGMLVGADWSRKSVKKAFDAIRIILK